MKSYCCYCGREFSSLLKSTTEHIVPKSKGGSDSPKNKRRCCVECNTWRGNKSLDYWRWEVQWQIDNAGRYKSFSIYDMEIILVNIDYVHQAIKTATPDMFQPFLRKRLFK